MHAQFTDMLVTFLDLTTHILASVAIFLLACLQDFRLREPRQTLRQRIEATSKQRLWYTRKTSHLLYPRSASLRRPGNEVLKLDCDTTAYT